MSQPSSDPPSQQPAPSGLAAESESTPVVRASFSMQGFMDGWLHCQHAADYLARFASSDRFDPEQLTTRLSTYLNEALELVFRSAPGPGELIVTIHRQHDRLDVALACPIAGDERMRRSVRRATEADAVATYRRGFAGLLITPPASEDLSEWEADAGLLELVALHGITLALHEAGDALVLHMTVPHE